MASFLEALESQSTALASHIAARLQSPLQKDCQLPSADLEVLDVGHQVEVRPSNPCGGPQNVIYAQPSTLPLGLPPSIAFKTEDIKADLLQSYLLNLGGLENHKPEFSQRYMTRVPNPASLLSTAPSPLTTGIGDVRLFHGKTDEPVFKEVPLECGQGDPTSSSSLSRKPANPKDVTFGISTNFPFLPGGFDRESSTDANGKPSFSSEELLNFDNLLDTPPGFKTGIKFEVVNKKSSVNANDDLVASLSRSSSKQNEEGQNEPSFKQLNTPAPTIEQDPELEALLSQPITRQISKTLNDDDDWVVMEDATKPVSNFAKLVPHMARSYPFELDTFQKLAVINMERHESVFVAAHTSAGKTVVAEYAISLCMSHMTKCVYTSPIKALSNQKFRDFREQFGNEKVGLLTGDVQVRPEAPCLIMTTEILRSMLYRGADLVRDVEWVVFDEVHYINDADRGVVWEEVIIMLPEHVKFVFLSATVPNTRQFAEWVGRTKKKRVHVISTLKRPVPLEHFLYAGSSPKNNDEIFKIVEAGGLALLPGGLSAATTAIKGEPDKKDGDKKAGTSAPTRGRDAYGPKGGGNRGFGPGDKNTYVSLVSMLSKKDLMPCVIFTFSKKRCESNADFLSSKDLTSSKEKSEIQVFFEASTKLLKGTDRTLPQVIRLRDMLKRGIAVHHSGILPILKEMVEILFSRGLVKILFATETFAMGVNMPARCVVFDSIRKHDGTDFRHLLPGEYTQMAGRAGRRGLDKTGTVIILLKGEAPDSHVLNQVLLGKPTVLASQFRLTYNMILNLIRVEGIRVEDMIKRSFSEIETQKHANKFKKEIATYTRELGSLTTLQCDLCTDIADYHSTCKELLSLSTSIMKTTLTKAPKAISEKMFVVVNTTMYHNCLAVVLRVGAPRAKIEDREFTVLVLCDPQRGPPSSSVPSTPPSSTSVGAKELMSDARDAVPLSSLYLPKNEVGYMVVVVSPLEIISITKEKLKSELPRMNNEKELLETARELHQMASKNPSGLPSLDARKEFKINDLDFVESTMRKESLLKMLKLFQCTKCPDFNAHYAIKHNELIIRDKMASLAFRLSDQNLSLLPDYTRRIEVLKTLAYLNEDAVIQLKGRVACEISTCNELLATELLFDNSLTHMEPAEIVALLSALVFQEGKCSAPKLTPTLTEGVARIKETAARIASVQLSCGMNTPIDEYLGELHFGLVEVVHEWANGTPFAEITNLTDVLEGSIVRCIVRLDETCRDFKNAARVVGDPVLHQKMDEASKLIKRDIVFAASLYTL